MVPWSLPGRRAGLLGDCADEGGPWSRLGRCLRRAFSADSASQRLDACLQVILRAGSWETMRSAVL